MKDDTSETKVLWVLEEERRDSFLSHPRIDRRPNWIFRHFIIVLDGKDGVNGR